ncbi:MAG: rhodanese-like domain-containing protein [Bacteroidetes bacterium]|jgi:rhodanese-related sulfurtransferase|nr:rhodanese-like domain-containing protein [Bacteroidota bacterium]
MIQAIKNLLGMGPKVDLGELINQGAIIVDVRSKGEYAGGHIKGSLNIPLDQLSENLKKFKSKEQAILTCCASGMRSASAKGILKSKGYTNVHNAGAWQNLKRYGK